MLALGIITSCLWFGVGVFVGWRRANNAYRIEFAKFPGSAETDPAWAKRNALWRAHAVFLGWTVAGLLGAILWFLLYVFLIFGQAAAEASSQSSSKKKSSGGLLFWLITGGLLLVNDESLRSIEENMDDFVIRLAVFITFLTVVGAILASR